MDEFWICEHCKSLNRIKSGKCYSCKIARGGRPTPPPSPPQGNPGPGAGPQGASGSATPTAGPAMQGGGAPPSPFSQQAPQQPSFTRQAPPPSQPIPFPQRTPFGQPPAAPPPAASGPAPQTRFGQTTVPFSGYPSTPGSAAPYGAQPSPYATQASPYGAQASGAPTPSPYGTQPPAGPGPSYAQPGQQPAWPVAPPMGWPPQAARKSNTKALSVVLGLALVVVIGAAAIIVAVPGLTKSSGASFLAVATASPTPTATPSPTPETTPSPTPEPTPTPKPSLAVAPAPKGYQQIVSPDLDYALSFPSSWVSVSAEDPRPIADQIATLKKAYPSLATLIDSETASLGQEYRVTLFDPSANTARKLMAGLFAVTEPVPPEDLKTGQAVLKSQLNALGTVTGLTITSIKEPAGPGLKAVGGMTPSGVSVKLVMYMIAAKNHAFVLVFVTTSTSYSAYAKTYDAVAAAIQEPPLP